MSVIVKGGGVADILILKKFPNGSLSVFYSFWKRLICHWFIRMKHSYSPSTEIMFQLCLILILKTVFLNNGGIWNPLCFESAPSFTCPIHAKFNWTRQWRGTVNSINTWVVQDPPMNCKRVNIFSPGKRFSSFKIHVLK